MKKIIICIFTVLFSTSAFAAETKHVDDLVYNSWGFPKASGLHNDFNKKIERAGREGYKGGKILLVYMARKIVAHGGYFCLTILDTKWDNNYGRLVRYRRPNEESCAWYCEPEFSGEGCTAGSSPVCNPKPMSKSDLKSDAIITTDTNTINKESLKNDNGLFTSGAFLNNGYESDTILVANSFLPSGHGIIASAATVSASNWSYNDNQSTNDAMTALIRSATTTETKYLCAQGWTGGDCNTRTTACTACPDNRVFIVDKDACSAGKLDPEHPGDKAYSCDGDRTKYMNHEGNCAGKGYTSASDIISKNCWKTLNSYDFHKCMNPTK